MAIAAFIASKTGKAEDFFLPGLLLNAAYALAYLISIAIRWPLIGVILGPLGGEGMAWRKDPEQVRLYSRASWIWVGVFTARLAVQLPLYLAGALLALGIAKTAMGHPDLPARDLADFPGSAPWGRGRGAPILLS